MSPEMQQALISLMGSTIGAVIGSGVIGYYLGTRREKIEADRKTYLKLKRHFTNNDLTHLQDANFYVGLPERIVDNIHAMAAQKNNPNIHAFKNRKLAKKASNLKAIVDSLSQEIARNTTSEGRSENDVITTRTPLARSCDTTRKRNQRESDELTDTARGFHDAAIALDTLALKVLRLSEADLPE